LEDSFSVVAVREAQVESSSLARRVLASLEQRKDCSEICQTMFSSANTRSAADRAAFSLDNAFFSSAIKATNPKTSLSQEKNHRIEAVKEERVPSQPTSASFSPSKKSVTHRTEYLASTMEQIVEPIPLIGGGAEPAATGEDTCGTTNG
jgi:hypothetical protein